MADLVRNTQLGENTLKVRINKVALEGTSRAIEFKAGLNIITGPIATGKTTLLRFCRALIGGSLDNLPPEARAGVRAISGEILVGTESYFIVRPVTTARTAKIDVASRSEAYRLPVFHADASAPITFSKWLMERLDLPRLQVPSAPTKPESDPTPITIGDYLLYCSLLQEEIGSSVFGHKDPFKNIKRKYVFEILYGLYSLETAQIQEELRNVQAKLRQLTNQSELFLSFLDGTALENRAQIDRNIYLLEENLREIENESKTIPDKLRAAPEVQVLQKKVLDIEFTIGRLASELDAEKRSQDNLQRLAKQFETQIGRITRSIVAQKYLVDIDFVICPRCGAAVASDRGNEDLCYLCLQPPQPVLTRESLIDEQARLEAQLIETQELLKSRSERTGELSKELDWLNDTADQARHELNFKTQTFVSSEASLISQLAERRAAVISNLSRYREYLNIFTKVDSVQKIIEDLKERRASLESALVLESTRAGKSKEQITFLEQEYNAILRQFYPPEFGEETSSGIDRQTYLPMFRGRRFDDLSSPGLATLVNVAHALAHHITNLTLGLSLPSILFIDALSEHLGQEGLDPQRLTAIYEYLLQISAQFGDHLQIFVVDNEIPQIAREFIRMELAENDRLIP